MAERGRHLLAQRDRSSARPRRKSKAQASAAGTSAAAGLAEAAVDELPISHSNAS